MICERTNTDIMDNNLYLSMQLYNFVEQRQTLPMQNGLVFSFMSLHFSLSLSLSLSSDSRLQQDNYHTGGYKQVISPIGLSLGVGMTHIYNFMSTPLILSNAFAVPLCQGGH